MLKKLLAILLAMTMALSILAGCKKDDKKPEDNTKTEDGKKEDDKKEDDKKEDDKKGDMGDQEVVFRTTGGKVATLNQHVYQTSAESDIFGLTLSGLIAVVYDEESKTFKFIPNMAEEMPTRSEDGLTWTFKLRKDLQWPDGTPITSKTFEYSWKMQLDPKLKNHRGADSWFSGDLGVVNAKKYWLGYSEDNIKLQKQKEEEAALEALKAEIDGMADGEEKDKKQAEYDERMSTLQANWVEVEEEDLAEGGCKWEDVGLKFPDDYTIVVNLEYAMPDVDFWLSFTEGPKSPVREELYEKGMNEDRTETTYGTSLDMMDYTGPYCMTVWTRDQYHEYVKNPNCTLAAYYTPDVVKMRVVEDANTLLQLFEKGETDHVGVQGDNYLKYEEDPRLVFSERETVWQMFINMTSDKPERAFLTDVNFRKALYYATNRQSIVDNVYKIGYPQPCFVASVKTVDALKGTTYRDTPEAKALEPENHGYLPEEAKKYFDMAYEKFGKKMEVELMYFENSDNMKKMCEFLEQEYEGLFGADRIDVQLRAVPWNNAYDKMEHADYDLGVGAWTGGLFNPWSSMEVYRSDFGIKCDQFKSKEFDELQIRTVKGDLIFKPQERIEALAELEKMLLDNMIAVPIYQPRGAIMFSDRIHLLTREWVPGVSFATYQAHMDPLAQ